MGIDKLIGIGLTLAILAASTGQLPNVIHSVQWAQYHLLEQSKSSRWPKAKLLPK